MPSAAVPQWTVKLRLEETPGGFPDDQRITSLLRLWQDKRAGRRLPARSDFPVEDLRPWLGQVSLVDVSEAPRRFRWRLIGSRIAERLGRDVTGRWFDEIYEGTMLDGYARAYSRAVDRREPVFHSGDLEFVGKEFQHFSSVHLPLSEDGETVNMLMLTLSFDQPLRPGS